MMVNCPQCGGSANDTAVFCQYCGTAIKRASAPPGSLVCPRCQTENPVDTSYCHACGGRVGPPAGQVASINTAAGRDPTAPPARLVAVRRDGSDGPIHNIVGAQFDIGRTEGDLLFDDPHIAPRHVRIQVRAGQHLLVPLDPLNGVYLRIREPVNLVDGDTWLIGKQVLRFDLLPDVERTLRPAVQHGIVLFGTPVKTPWGRLRQMTSAGTARDVYHLARSDIVLGREQGDLVFSDDEFLSRRHAQIAYRGGRVVLQDLGSSNGTYLRLRGQHTLFPGEMLRVGDELLRFDLA